MKNAVVARADSTVREATQLLDEIEQAAARDWLAKRTASLTPARIHARAEVARSRGRVWPRPMLELTYLMPGEPVGEGFSTTSSSARWPRPFPPHDLDGRYWNQPR